MMHKELFEYLEYLYGVERAEEYYPKLAAIVSNYALLLRDPPDSDTYFSQRDAVLITYGDMVRAPEEQPLHTLQDFLTATIGDAVNTVHLLPFFPYSSDDGFSIIDYRRVNQDLGDWSDIMAFEESYRLMFDAVVNHVSAESRWFERFCAGAAPYDGYFITVPEDANLSQVFRPRSLPLLTRFDTAAGPQLVWTTFSADQVDLNFANPEVLLAVIDLLLFYVTKGAALIRLDAIAYIWKEAGSPCIHLPQTHHIIRLMRAVLDIVAPDVILITETNVPHADNISYFGDGHNEAQMVYNFSLPPLTLHAFHHGDAQVLTQWASTLTLPSSDVTFFNFLASHDGVGLTPARGLLPEEDVLAIAERVEALGGFVSYRNDPLVGDIPYELNIGYIDALGDPTREEAVDLVARRFLAAQAIMLALRGVPGIYFHSLYGSRSWANGAAITGQKRTINRQKLDRREVEQELADKHALRARVFFPYAYMLRCRSAEPAFHPTAAQEMLNVHPSLFALWRHSMDGGRHVLCLQNVANEPVEIDLDAEPYGGDQSKFVELLSKKTFSAETGRLRLIVPPYGIYWLLLMPD